MIMIASKRSISTHMYILRTLPLCTIFSISFHYGVFIGIVNATSYIGGLTKIVSHTCF